jgi:hypothetical protein
MQHIVLSPSYALLIVVRLQDQQLGLALFLLV